MSTLMSQGARTIPAPRTCTHPLLQSSLDRQAPAHVVEAWAGFSMALGSALPVGDSWRAPAVMKQCTKCFAFEEETAFSLDRGRRIAACKACRKAYALATADRFRERKRAYQARYWRTEEHRKDRLEKARRWCKKYPEKHCAHSAVSRALASGSLVRPLACSACGAVGQVEAHHHRGYERAFWLDVHWVCRPCHRRLEKGRAPAPPIPRELWRAQPKPRPTHCAIEGCGKAYYCKGVCEPHYKKAHRLRSGLARAREIVEHLPREAGVE